MCFSATANFVGSGVLGTIGVVTLKKVKHRRELLFAALPALFALHQFMEGFVWLGLDGTLSATVAHVMGAAAREGSAVALHFARSPDHPIARSPDSVRYAFTSLWCAYAAAASVIILAYFWKSMRRRPFRYV